jgi:hypothetical protein
VKIESTSLSAHVRLMYVVSIIIKRQLTRKHSVSASYYQGVLRRTAKFLSSDGLA